MNMDINRIDIEIHIDKDIDIDIDIDIDRQQRGYANTGAGHYQLQRAQQPDVDLDRVLAVHGAVHQHGLDQAEARDGDGLTVRRGRGHLVALLTIVKIVR